MFLFTLSMLMYKVFRAVGMLEIAKILRRFTAFSEYDFPKRQRIKSANIIIKVVAGMSISPVNLIALKNSRFNWLRLCEPSASKAKPVESATENNKEAIIQAT